MSEVIDTERRRLLAAAAVAPLAACTAPSTAPGTAPGAAPGAAATEPRASMRIAFGSCARQNKPQPIWATIAAAQPDLFMFLGDNFYADAQDEATLRARYGAFREVAPLQAFRRATPHVAIWDDHDFGDDDVGGDYRLKALSQQLFCDEWGEPADSKRRTRPGVFESYLHGPVGRRVQVILLDLRFNRTPLVTDPALHQGYDAMVREARRSGEPMSGWYVPNPDPQATMLGEAQWAWLEQQLRVPADVRIIGSSIQFAADGTGWEAWANFPHERKRFAALLRSTRAEGVVIVSGDMHYADLSRWPTDGGYDLWDLTSSGLTEVWDIPTPNRNRQSEVIAEPNFGLIDIVWATTPSGPPTAIKLGIVDVQGRTRLAHALSLEQLRFDAKPQPKGI